MRRLIDHIDLRVRNLTHAGPFYRELLPALGFTVRADIAGWLQFEAAGAEPTAFFGVTEDSGHTVNRSRIAFWAESNQRVDELAEVVRNLGGLNIEGPGWEGTGYYAVYFDDPSGNPLEVCHRARRFDQSSDVAGFEPNSPML